MNEIQYLPIREESYQNRVTRLFPEININNKKINQITFQVTEDCCMACTYCYQNNKTKNKMTFETAKEFIDKLLNDKYENVNTTNSFTVIFDFIGGEPLMEIDLIEQICDYSINSMIDLQHPWLLGFRINICSNGILYDNIKVQKFFEKYNRIIGFTISIDGNKELHDACRIDLNGNGTYDRAIAAVRKHKDKYHWMPQTKMTIAPNNVAHVYEAVINLISENYTDINFNCVFENVWNKNYANIFYYQLKLIADHLIYNNLYNKIFISRFSEDSYDPIEESNNLNWCGGTEYSNISINYKGDFYPCIRYMESSLNGKQKPIIIGNIKNDIGNSQFHKQNIEKISNITRRSQSTDECFYCPIGSGCAWCSAYNYEEFGTPNKRATYICCMHKAEALANVYYWNTLYQYLGIDKTFEMHIPKEWALEIIDEDEYNMLYELSHKNASQL